MNNEFREKHRVIQMPKLEVNEEAVRKLADLLKEMELSEIEYESGDQKIRVARGQILAVQSLPPAPVAGLAPAAAKTEEGPPAGAVVSPMVGTVYTAPEPGAPNFVNVGDTVQKGQTLLIIEAMKVMNPLPSPRAGRVAQVLVESGAPVEFGEPLVVIE